MINRVSLGKKKAEILLVEDNRGDAVLAARAFRNAPIPVNLELADSAEQALSILRREFGYETRARPDLILLDLNLPRMHGLEFLKIVKADESLKQIPVVILSSSHAEQDVVRSYGHYASGYIVKPLGLDDFKDIAGVIEQFFFKLVTLPETANLQQSQAAP